MVTTAVPDASGPSQAHATAPGLRTPAAPQSCAVLYQTESSLIVLLDIPRSIEEGQGPGSRRRIVSSAPPVSPHPIPEPSDGGEKRQASLPPSALLGELITADAARRGLEEVRRNYHGGVWCLPRVIVESSPSTVFERGRKKRKTSDGDIPKDQQDNDTEAAPVESSTQDPLPVNKQDGGEQDNDPVKDPSNDYHIPLSSNYIRGSIHSTRTHFLLPAPVTQPQTFNLILLDPPWPNRSAKRKKNTYTTQPSLTQTRTLLNLLPVPSRLSTHGLLAIWTTNSPGVHDLLTSPKTGVLASWGLEVAAEWTWLKITAEKGEPLFDLDSQSRKPWERLVIAKRQGEQPDGRRRNVEGKVILAVPDLHSRKPCLKGLFEAVLGTGYTGLEVFARNLTSGWWSWGDEVLKFQHKDHWQMAEGEWDAEVNGKDK